MLHTNMRPSQFAAAHGFTPQTVYRVIKGEMRTEKVRQAISKATGIPVDAFWPDDDSLRADCSLVTTVTRQKWSLQAER